MCQEDQAASQQISLFAVTRKLTDDDRGESNHNAQASRLLGRNVFGRVYLICRSASRVVDYFPADFIRDSQLTHHEGHQAL
jgi:hypothetical protein